MLEFPPMAAHPYQPPTGRISTKRRNFEEVVRDLRYAIFSVLRQRSLPNNQAEIHALGSGFFVSDSIFLTCHHVLMPANRPHQDGDTYQLVSNLTGQSGIAHSIQEAHLGQNVFLYPASDLALLAIAPPGHQAHVSLEYGDLHVGRDIGVAGYPLPQILVANNQVSYAGLIFRVARGPIASTFVMNINLENGGVLDHVPIIEVNFLFVPGNSGGPVFDVETGRVSGFVHGYNSVKIRERVQTVSMVADPLPPGLNQQYIENLNALYSIAIKLERVRPQLEQHGVHL
jgi:S1-C subfamily serine protease